MPEPRNDPEPEPEDLTGAERENDPASRFPDDPAEEPGEQEAS
jgi:hypothetical protein